MQKPAEQSRQLGGAADLADLAEREVGLAGRLGVELDAAVEAAVPGLHGLQLLARQQALQVGHDVARVEVGDAGAPARADALRAVHQYHWQDGRVPAAPAVLLRGCPLLCQKVKLWPEVRAM